MCRAIFHLDLYGGLKKVSAILPYEAKFSFPEGLLFSTLFTVKSEPKSFSHVSLCGRVFAHPKTSFVSVCVLWVSKAQFKQSPVRLNALSPADIRC